MRRTRVSTDIPFRSRSIIRSTMTPAGSPAMTNFSMVAVIGFSMGLPPLVARVGKMDAAVCYLFHRDPNQDTRWRFFKVRRSPTAILLRICMGHSNGAAIGFEKARPTVERSDLKHRWEFSCFSNLRLAYISARRFEPAQSDLWFRRSGSLVRNSHWAQTHDLTAAVGRRRGSQVSPVRAMDPQCAFTHNELG